MVNGANDNRHIEMAMAMDTTPNCHVFLYVRKIGRKPNKNDKALIEKLEKRSEIYPNLLSPTFFSTFTVCHF